MDVIETTAHILISHKDAAFKKDLTDPLKSLGCVVHHALSGAATWSALKLRSYDLVILDMRLPDLGGLELLRIMRSLDWSPRVLLIDDRSVPEIESIAIALGADVCCPKQEMLDVITRLLNDTERCDGVCKTGSDGFRR